MAKTSPEPQLSVIVPVFNEEKTILGVLEALEKALSLPHEVIVVDDGSADGTAAIVETFAKKHTVRAPDPPTAEQGQDRGAGDRFCRKPRGHRHRPGRGYGI